MSAPAQTPIEPDRDCPLCPRLAAFRAIARARIPGGHNAPVPSFGGLEARLLIVGLAPGLKGANRTGRPFTGDYAGELLYGTLVTFGFAEGDYRARPDDGLRLIDARITNAARCVPPENRPTPLEIATCRGFLSAEIAAMPHLSALVCLGNISHGAVLACFGLKVARYPFGHAAEYALPRGIALFDSYHCSRLNTNTGRLTAAMFESVFARIRERLRTS
jgi:uracil-DNA glycosylase family 4